MKNFSNFFITGLVAGLVAFSGGVLVTPTQLAQGAPPQPAPPIADNSITSSKIRDGEVKNPDLDNDAVTTSKVADNTITPSKIANGAVTKEKLSPSAVKLVVIERKVSDQVVRVETLRVQCNPDEIVTGGGGGSGNAEIVIVSDQRFENGWQMTYNNFIDQSLPAFVVAECAHLELGP